MSRSRPLSPSQARIMAALWHLTIGIGELPDLTTDHWSLPATLAALGRRGYVAHGELTGPGRVWCAAVAVKTRAPLGYQYIVADDIAWLYRPNP